MVGGTVLWPLFKREISKKKDHSSCIQIQQKGKRELQNLACSINYDKPRAPGQNWISVFAGVLRGVLTVVNEDRLMECCDLGSASLRLIVKDILHRNKAQIALIQETKITSLSDTIIK